MKVERRREENERRDEMKMVLKVVGESREKVVCFKRKREKWEKRGRRTREREREVEEGEGCVVGGGF